MWISIVLKLYSFMVDIYISKIEWRVELAYFVKYIDSRQR